MILSPKYKITRPMMQTNKNFYRWIKLCNQHDMRQFTPLCIQDCVVGYLHKDQLEHIITPELSIQNNQLLLKLENDNVDTRTQFFADLTQKLYQKGIITSWVGEQYDVAENFDAPALFTIERAAATLFGIQKYGVHVNAYTIIDGKYHIWVARRATDKPTWPGKLDHLVAGGHASGMDIQTTLIKECKEEANLDESLSSAAIPVGTIDYNQQVNNKISRDLIFNYDLCLPQDFNPVNTDGEVESFYLSPIEDVLNTVSNTDEYKTNCNLVIIDFAIRHGFLKPDEKLYTQIVKGLRNNNLVLSSLL